MLIVLADGVPVAEGEAAVQRVADRFGAPDVQTNQEFTESIAGEINLYLTVVYVLLILAIVIVVLALGALVGVLAAVCPAHRAARMNVLSAIASSDRRNRAAGALPWSTLSRGWEREQS